MGTILLSAGGTGGHVLPAILVAKEIDRKKPGQRVIILGVGTQIENRLLSNTNIEHLVVRSRGVVGSGLFAKLASVTSHFLNVFSIRKILKDNSVESVLGFGGYPSFMPLVVARICGLKTYLFEQNGKAGLANKLASLFVGKVFSVPFSEGLLSSKVTYIFNPVRDEIRNFNSTSNETNLDSYLNILIVGGSQGAVGMNSLVVHVLKDLNRADISIVHQTGERDIERVRSLYQGIDSKLEVVAFLDDMATAYQKADLVISRGGAGSYGEILAVEKPCIFIPLPISRGHQYYNVKHLVAAGGALVVHQGDDENSSGKLHSIIAKFMQDANFKIKIKEDLIGFKKNIIAESGQKVLSKVLLEDLGVA